MFANACELARSFTRPVVLSRRDRAGNCSAAIGTFIVVNKDGWAVTAWHIVEEAERAAKATKEFQDAEASRATIYADPTIDKKERSRRLKALPTFPSDATTNTSAWWSWDPVRTKDIVAVPAVDLAFVKLESFDPASVVTYPVFKDPTKPMQPGRSLCRLGFPFHTVRPVFHPDKNAFELPPGSIPLPLFPNDGILTRIVEVEVNPPLNPPPPFKLRLIETSTPGFAAKAVVRYSIRTAPFGVSRAERCIIPLASARQSLAEGRTKRSTSS
ncbi:MAG: serine protease [Acidobacteria bacterium]|nr:serine protease [Nitrospiraceae bacterium]MCI0723600.1 serine protease [Acidobacteriota bacterium]